MQSVAAVYNRIERAAMRHDRRPLYDWMARRADYRVHEAINHAVKMAYNDFYRLGVEAYRFAREYEEAFDTHSGGMGAFSLDTEQKQWVNALREGALRLRAGIDTDASAVATRREVERLLGVMRAELDALRAPAPPPVAPVPTPVAPASTLRASIQPRDARKGDRIVDVETRKDGTIEVAFGFYATDDAGRFEWRSARGQVTRVFKTRAGADKAIRAWLDR